VTAREEQELRALVCQAYDHRDSPYLVDFCTAIVEWFERRPLARLEHEQDRHARLRRLLRETA
jgi:hypothetical protein